jgi:DNA topoisomerase-3
VNGCDAGREGELIFRYVYELAGSRLAVRRLWISSLTEEAIRDGFARLRPGAQYDALADAARCRSEADWLVGMNATRAVTISFRRGNAPREEKPPVYSIGRVQTPTLAIIVRREQAIRAFQPRDYWEVRGTFATAAVPGSDAETFVAQWVAPADARKRSANRFGERPLADQVTERAREHAAATDPAGPIVERLTQKRSREPPPLLFDLTSLQRTANRRYGLSASSTLDAAQALYERHKILTYPRTDSRHLPDDLAGELPKLFAGLAKLLVYAPFAEPLLAAPPIALARARRIFDASKVHDHHAIIPTGKVPNLDALSSDERRIFDLVARRFLGAFHPDAELALTEVVVRVGQPDGVDPAASTGTPEDAFIATLPAPPDRFVARGRVRLVAGWQTVAGIDDKGSAGGRDKATDQIADDQARLPQLTEGQRLDGRFEVMDRQTRPPPRHTEATLLGAMESAGREIEDETLRAAMKDTGLGTPATRAATIETLLKRKFISREGKMLVATPSGIELIDRLPVPTLASPELTGAWEARLARISRGQEPRAGFMADIARYVREMTDAIRGVRPAGAAPAAATPVATPAPSAKPTPAAAPTPAEAPPAATAAWAASTTLPCPRCKRGTLMAGRRGWGCTRWREGCAFVIWFEVAGRRLTGAQLRDLVEKGKTRKSKWAPRGETPVVAGRLVLDLAATPDNGGGARFQAS